MRPGIFRFGDFVLDVSAYALRRQGRSVRLERRPMELLLLLLDRRGELITRDDIVARLWGRDVFIDIDSSVNTAIRKRRWGVCIFCSRNGTDRGDVPARRPSRGPGGP